MKLIYIPLDERPCNLYFPQLMFGANDDIQCIVPSQQILGNKKKSADVEEIWRFIEQHASGSDAIVASLDMLIYGGLLPSRLHHFSKEEALERLEKLKRIKSLYPNVKIYGFSLIMRTPKYSSSDEEPDYYEEYGEQIFKRSWLRDKKNRIGLGTDEEAELLHYEEMIPKEHIKDYEDRRAINIEVNKYVLQLVKEGIIDFLAIPQDDSAEFGYTAMDQKKVVTTINELKVQRKVYMYPGADEVGASLSARAYNDFLGRKPKIYAYYSSTLGPTIVPLYEDRILHESLKYHVLVTNSVLVSDAKEADFILAINSAGKVMQEARDQQDRDITYSSYRNVLAFVYEMESYIEEGKDVLVADVAFANGGDGELIQLMDEVGVLDKVLSYKGWNTNCNTLGTTIAAGLLAKKGHPIVKYNLLYHLFDDVMYQGFIRNEITEVVLPKMGLNYFSLGKQQEDVHKIIKKRIEEEYKKRIKNTFKEIEIYSLQTYSPWNRMFEVGINLETKVKGYEKVFSV